MAAVQPGARRVRHGVRPGNDATGELVLVVVLGQMLINSWVCAAVFFFFFFF